MQNPVDRKCARFSSFKCKCRIFETWKQNRRELKISSRNGIKLIVNACNLNFERNPIQFQVWFKFKRPSDLRFFFLPEEDYSHTHTIFALRMCVVYFLLGWSPALRCWTACDHWDLSSPFCSSLAIFFPHFLLLWTCSSTRRFTRYYISPYFNLHFCPIFHCE